MGLRDDIMTLEARQSAGQDVVTPLAEAYAQMVGRKSSKRLVWSWFDSLADLLEKAGRYPELIVAAGGVDPSDLGAWDCQEAVGKWLRKERKSKCSTRPSQTTRA